LGIFLLDGHETVRARLRSLLVAPEDLVVVGEAATAAEALTRILSTKPGVPLLDVRLPDGSGLEVCREIRSRSPEVACDAHLLRRRRGALRHRHGEEGPRLASLSNQQHRILALIADGQTNRQIAAAMYLAEKTVKNYVSHILAKLGMSRRTQAARFDERSAQANLRDASGT